MTNDMQYTRQGRLPHYYHPNIWWLKCKKKKGLNKQMNKQITKITAAMHDIQNLVEAKSRGKKNEKDNNWVNKELEYH